MNRSLRHHPRLANVWLLFLIGSLCLVGAQNPKPAPDAWLTNSAPFPEFVDTNFLRAADFVTLRAEVIAGRLRILWRPQVPDTNGTANLFASADEPGHWPARDWRRFPMTFRGSEWETNAPVEDLDVPLMYFVQAVERGVTNISPMRLCRPRAAGLEVPTRVFWPFLDGFEEGLESWRVLTNKTQPAGLSVDPAAKSGHSALRVALPAGRRVVAVATTRVRGWQIDRNVATGLRLWLRVREGTGRARFTLSSNAGTTNQVISVSPNEARLTDAWQRVDLPFSSFAKLPLMEVDLFTIEFVGVGPQEFLVDDLQLLGRWKLVPE